MSEPRPTYRITLECLPDVVPVEIRLRALLKYALRVEEVQDEPDHREHASSDFPSSPEV